MVRIFPYSDIFLWSEYGKIGTRKNSVFGHFSKEDIASLLTIVYSTLQWKNATMSIQRKYNVTMKSCHCVY